MTDLNLMAGFEKHFNPYSLIARSVAWQKYQLPQLEQEYYEVVSLLKKGELPKEDRATLYADRNNLKDKIDYGDPSYLKNSRIDQWIRADKLRIRDLNKSECRNIIIQRLNNLLRTSNEKFILISKGRKGGMYVMDQLMALEYSTINADKRNTQFVKNHNGRLIDGWGVAADKYDLDPTMVESIVSPLEIMSLNQENTPGEHRQIEHKLNYVYRPLLEMERSKLLANQKEIVA